jgi:transposase-like protein
MEATKKRSKPYYSESLKRQVVREYSSGYYSKTDLMLKYGILGSTTVDDWLEKYGNFADKFASESTGEKKKSHQKDIMGKQGKNVEEATCELVQLKGVSKRQRSEEQERISELEGQLAKEKLRQQLYLRIIELASEEYGEDLLKKIGIEQLKAGKKGVG